MPIFGIDVSANNGSLNHLAIKYAGVRFAMVKASQGHRLYGPDTYLFTDSSFKRNIEGFTKMGIPVGAYHFFTASTLAEAYREADFFIKTVEPYRDKIELYLACDAEAYDNPYIDKLSRAELTNLIDMFLKRVQAAGYHVCYYTNTDHIRNRLDISKLDFPVWQAHYIQNGSSQKPLDAGARLAIHQYTGSGQLVGVVGEFDRNFGYGPLARLIISSRTSIEEQTLDFIARYETGDNILTRLADIIVAKSIKPIIGASHEQIVALVRMYCRLAPDEAAYLNSYRWSVELFQKLYGAMTMR